MTKFRRPGASFCVEDFYFSYVQKADSKVSFPKWKKKFGIWEKEKIFEKSVSKDAPKGDFVFYEGRRQQMDGRDCTMSWRDRLIDAIQNDEGYRVAWKADGDTHGLPVELQVEKALGLKNKKNHLRISCWRQCASVIEFNKRCKASVWEYRELWENSRSAWAIVVDMEHPYVTYENGYIESFWWQLAQIAKPKPQKASRFSVQGTQGGAVLLSVGRRFRRMRSRRGIKKRRTITVYVELGQCRGQKIKGLTNR